MSTEDNKAVLRRWNEEIFNKKRIDRADELVTQDYVDHAALPGQAPGLEGAKHKWAMYVAAIPGLAPASVAWPRGRWPSSSSGVTGWTSCSNWASSPHGGRGQSRPIHGVAIVPREPIKYVM
jgi:hypothetical protein